MGRFKDAEQDWWQGWPRFRYPLWWWPLWVIGKHRRGMPKVVRSIGFRAAQVRVPREHGFSSDFSHVEMLVSQPAQQEVWPLVRNWLSEL